MFREELIKKTVDWAITQIDHLNTSPQISPDSGDDACLTPRTLCKYYVEADQVDADARRS